MTDFLPRQPGLYTVEAMGRPVVVLSANSEPVPEDNWLADPQFAEAMRKGGEAMRALHARAKQMGSELDEDVAFREVDEAFETYLGEDLKRLEDADKPGLPL